MMTGVFLCFHTTPTRTAHTWGVTRPAGGARSFPKECLGKHGIAHVVLKISSRYCSPGATSPRRSRARTRLEARCDRLVKWWGGEVVRW